MSSGLDIVFVGLSITSSWGNGHATTYRGLVRELAARGHRIRFLERDQPWYAAHRDMPAPGGAETHIYSSLDELFIDHGPAVRGADVVIVGSYVPDGVAVGEWVSDTATGIAAFYDIDTPVTLAKLRAGDTQYLSSELVRRYDLYLSFTGGPTLDVIEREFGSPYARPLYCSVDHTQYHPEDGPERWALGYLGTYSDDRQPALERLLIEPARTCGMLRFAVAGPQYPAAITWPPNVERIEHLAPSDHRWFYNSQRFTLNVTRAAMVEAGYSPSVRLFESAACGTPAITDFWPGLDAFFAIDEEIVVAHDAHDVVKALRAMRAVEVEQIGRAARERVLRSHTAAHRAAELEGYLVDLLGADVSGTVIADEAQQATDGPGLPYPGAP
ncbi:MAG TPA: glycosyltransferase [Gemmatimonadaceae bacterium]|nr:glycosyltransferase [Gemmatimonadaceae bacterium]